MHLFLRLSFSFGIIAERRRTSLYVYVTKTQCRNQVATTGGHIAPGITLRTREYALRAATNCEVARRRYFRRIGVLHHADAMFVLIEIIAMLTR